GVDRRLEGGTGIRPVFRQGEARRPPGLLLVHHRRADPREAVGAQGAPVGGDQVPAVGLEHEAEWIQEPTAGRLLASGPTVVDGQAAARPHRARDLRQGSGVFGLGEPALVIDQEAFLAGSTVSTCAAFVVSIFRRAVSKSVCSPRPRAPASPMISACSSGAVIPVIGDLQPSTSPTPPAGPVRVQTGTPISCRTEISRWI